MKSHKVTVIPGDGIGPEVIGATRKMIDATGVRIEWEEAEAGASVFRKGIASGVPNETIESISRTRCVLKGPLETPVGFGEKSANVTLRKLFETFGNVRPVREFPGVTTPFSGRGLDFVIVRENVEDLYAGIEYMQTPGVAECLKLISRKGCEKVVRLAFELARAEGRSSVHCATKANIMKLTEGFLKRTFEEIAKEYPDIQAHHIIVDNCAHQLAKKPEQFEVIVTTNMNGDILSDLGSGLIGGLGFAPSANLGDGIAIFEAVHGSAPKYAGKNVANPTAVALSGVMMLRYLGELEAASKLENAILFTFEEGKTVPRDVPGVQNPTGTAEFADAVIANLGKVPSKLAARNYKQIKIPSLPRDPVVVVPSNRRTVGCDIFLEAGCSANQLGEFLEKTAPAFGLKLKMISNRGTQVYPSKGANTDAVDHWRCRHLAIETFPDNACLANYLDAIEKAGFRWMHLEKLEEIDGSNGFTKAQGED
ncbi:MAG: NADP-dependent isocitrate dehydrogenase [Chthoniobacterales bacterium]|nr:NADP-dependent isocitrate dehydrogenase [Chthoniobacterales bacterium]